MKQQEIGERVTGRGLLIVGACLGVVTIAVACGGKVTWVEDGAANTGGTGSSSQSSGSKMTSVTSSKSASSGPSTGSVIPSSCEKICSIPGCSNGDPACLPDCQKLYTPGCEAQAEQYLACVANNADQNCKVAPNVCDAVAVAYQQCAGSGNCTTAECQGGGSFCSCDGVCFGSKVNAACKATPMGFQCDCVQNGVLVGQCSDMTLTCSLDEGCCAQFFGQILD
ncbi:MAG: hypothetical protein U0414_05255 [Polyangiaceae bacterium]